MEDAASAGPRISVDKRTLEAFECLFTIDKGRKGGIGWKTFVKAMTHIGFQYHPKTGGGSGRVFEPDDYPSRERFFWDEPHSRKQGGKGYMRRSTQRRLASKLSETYGWNNFTFVLAS
ncbi:hypothetical protein FKP32DRAFT_1681524 [Trametes sanguinea]|nr:hypothetical protein FKP32DRAFT_1681524 [Trametes sanguinea]